MVVKDKNVLVFGSGISGEAACELLLKEEAKVVLYDCLLYTSPSPRD